MSGYVFHCTPCGKPHAGECPPRALPAPDFGRVGIGSVWRAQTRVLPFGGWESGFTKWVVQPWPQNGKGDPDMIPIGASDVPSLLYYYNVAHWKEDGAISPSSGDVLRFIPYVAGGG